MDLSLLFMYKVHVVDVVVLLPRWEILGFRIFQRMMEAGFLPPTFFFSVQQNFHEAVIVLTIQYLFINRHCQRSFRSFCAYSDFWNA